MRALPCLEPINQSPTGSEVQLNTNNTTKVQRSSSIGTIHESGLKTTKLPALLEPPNAISSATSLDELRDPMPLYNKATSLSLPPSRGGDEQKQQNPQHPLKRKQPVSFDETVTPNVSGSNNKNDGMLNKDLSKNRLIRSNDLNPLIQSSTDTLLDMLKAYAGIKECSDETQVHLNMILLELYSRVKGTQCNRGAILGVLYGLVECNSPKILLAIARIVLSMNNISGSNLTGACKLVFKVARNEVNDSLFIDSDVPELLVDALGRVNPTAEGEPEAAIYGYGAIRFLATANLNTLSKKTENVEGKTIKISKQKSLAYRLVRHGIIQLMIVHLQIINEHGSTNKLCGQPLHALYQLSGALRVLSGSPVFAQIINMKHSRASSIDEEDTHLEIAGKHLVRAAEICMDEIEVQTNIIRTLSILSEIETCCENMAVDAGRLGILFGPIAYNYSSTCSPEKALGVISRLGYILGNIHAKYDEARLDFFNNDAAMEYLLNTLEFFSNQRFDIKNTNGDTVMDALIKLIRVIANMSVNAEVGYGLGLRHPLGVVLLNILLEAKEIKTEEALELVLATLAALHNLSYYQYSTEDINVNHPGSIIERMRDISAALCQILSTGPVTAKSEAARVLGNLTRNSTARQSFCTSNGLKILVKCLQSDDTELVTASCGVLVNLLGDWERRASFKELNGIKILREILQSAAYNEDWLLSGMCCQAFWNFLIDSSNVVETLGESESDLLGGELAEYLDEERIFQGNPPDQIWEQFAQVATDLLERLQSCMSITNSPINTSDDDEDLNPSPIKNDSWGGNYEKWVQD
ncbi:armadillo repeat-containing protein 2 [Chironomus tepperi]|uniref:armadillo repeat-containing protein 2 n=1 Tax=Chironomus tepperi TaxID=113505 RepID=UPI00391EE5F8